MCSLDRCLGVPRLHSIPCHCHPDTSQPPHGFCCHPLSPGAPWVGTEVAADDAGRAVCLPQPHHALVLPRPSTSPCASPLSLWELGLAWLTGRWHLCSHPPAQCPAQDHIVPQTSHQRCAGAISVPQAISGQDREVGERCWSARLGAGACQAQMGLLVVVKSIQPLLKSPSAATRPHGLQWWRFPQEWCWRWLPLPLMSIPRPGYRVTAALHHVPTTWSLLLCRRVGSGWAP